MNRQHYLPALRFDALTPLYDFIIQRVLPEAEFKHRLVAQARIESGHRVLDVGCGTATLTVFIKTMHPGAEVIGLDGDSKILEFAKRKVAEAGLNVALDLGMAYQLPYPDCSFDRVLSSLVLHHLTRENKLRALREMHRVLRPGGEMHVADWGRAEGALRRAAFVLEQLFDGFENTSDNVLGRLPQMFCDAGFEDVQETGRYKTVFAALYLYRARKPMTVTADTVVNCHHASEN